MPAISFESGNDLVNGGIARGEALAKDYTDKRYHQPDDEWSPSWDFTRHGRGRARCCTPSASASPTRATGRTGATTANSAPRATNPQRDAAPPAAERSRLQSVGERGLSRRAKGVVRGFAEVREEHATWPTSFSTPTRMSRGQIVRWMLEEVGEPYETEILDYATTMKSEPYLSINPMGKVPAIKHDGKVVTEVAAICCYLADAFPEAGLAPADDDRADYYRWIFFTSGPVEAAFSNKAAGWEPTPGRQRMFGYGNYDLAIATLEEALSRQGLYRRRPFHRGRPVRRRQRQFHARSSTCSSRRDSVHRLCRADDRPRRLSAAPRRSTSELIAEMQAQPAQQQPA